MHTRLICWYNCLKRIVRFPIVMGSGVHNYLRSGFTFARDNEQFENHILFSFVVDAPPNSPTPVSSY